MFEDTIKSHYEYSKVKMISLLLEKYSDEQAKALVSIWLNKHIYGCKYSAYYEGIISTWPTPDQVESENRNDSDSNTETIHLAPIDGDGFFPDDDAEEDFNENFLHTNSECLPPFQFSQNYFQSNNMVCQFDSAPLHSNTNNQYFPPSFNPRPIYSNDQFSTAGPFNDPSPPFACPPNQNLPFDPFNPMFHPPQIPPVYHPDIQSQPPSFSHNNSNLPYNFGNAEPSAPRYSSRSYKPFTYNPNAKEYVPK